MKTFLTNNSSETKSLGEEFSKSLGDLILLYGDLGAGKTTFVQGLAQGLGIKDRILSPTFVLVRTHEIPNYSSSERSESSPLRRKGYEGQGSSLALPKLNAKEGRQARTRNLYHVDLYRIHKQTDIIGLGLGELINEEGSITIIEWADRLLDFKPKKSLLAGRQGYKIWFENIGDDKRRIRVEKI